MLTAQERLILLLRQVDRAQADLKRLQESAEQYQGQRDYPALIQLAEERLATAETILVLMQAWDPPASQILSMPLALHHALEHLKPTEAALPSSNACERKTSSLPNPALTHATVKAIKT